MEPNNIKALTLILTMEQSKALSKLTRKYRLSSTTVIAFGTISSYFLNMLGITSDRREIIKILMEEEFLEEFCSALNDKLQLDKPGHGIAYITMYLHAGVCIVEKIYLLTKQEGWIRRIVCIRK